MTDDPTPTRSPGRWWIARIALLIMLVGPLMAALPIPARAGGATFTVNSIGDDDDPSPDGLCDLCTLREAIQEANALPGQDTIAFDIPGSDPHVISPASALGNATDPLTIDGFTQPEAVKNTNATGPINAMLKIVLSGASAGPVNGLTFSPTATDSIVRGLVINSFAFSGISSAAEGVTIDGNFIGTDAAGTADQGNGIGADLFESNLTVGGLIPAQRNLISGNSGPGIRLGAGGNTGLVVQGNLIGTDVTAAGNLGNSGPGILLLQGVANSTIGGTTDAAGNVIGFNTGVGIRLDFDGGVGNRFLRNSIFSNASPGIDIGLTFVDENDPKHRDSGANRLQNSPVLTSATINGGQTTIKGKLNSTPNTKFTVQLFASQVGDGFNQGKRFLGQKTVTTDDKGKGSFSLATNVPVTAGDMITATATHKKKGDTSEFSTAVTAANG